MKIYLPCLLKTTNERKKLKQKKTEPSQKAKLILEDKNIFEGYLFGYHKSVAGEVVFNTGMVGYPETLTDPSYKGQILVLTYPLIGNYGVPQLNDSDDLPENFESNKIQVEALVVSENSAEFNHWSALQSLSDWLYKFKVPGLSGVDTRKLTKLLRERGTMLGKIQVENEKIDFYNPDIDNLIEKVTVTQTEIYGNGKRRIILIDCGCKKSIISNLIERNVQVVRVPYNYNFDNENYDGVVISNGPGNPVVYKELVEQTKKLLKKQVPTLGICMGHQILALAAGAKTYKLKYGHRGQNQPVREEGSNKCYITSQNHSFAVDSKKLPSGWTEWFKNLNDGTNEGLVHKKLPFKSVQFHPEAAPGPVDTSFIFDEFLKDVK
ncbi:glutamine-hydrolyzing carbamoyl-phosphate synthase small subunit [Melioribacteraceae bacterium 4301-Me]|uniref:glutamine-hydrolyzing carbamoyl-phosphate synthase small subunit n=1 Tax=Pyranulibacter aquaticus TaxID=3163344 RepID=UPI003598898B